MNKVTQTALAMALAATSVMAMIGVQAVSAMPQAFERKTERCSKDANNPTVINKRIVRHSHALTEMKKYTPNGTMRSKLYRTKNGSSFRIHSVYLNERTGYQTSMVCYFTSKTGEVTR